MTFDGTCLGCVSVSIVKFWFRLIFVQLFLYENYFTPCVILFGVHAGRSASVNVFRYDKQYR